MAAGVDAVVWIPGRVGNQGTKMLVALYADRLLTLDSWSPGVLRMAFVWSLDSIGRLDDWIVM